MATDVKENKPNATKKKLVKFFREVKSELKKVIWPNRQQLTNNTLTVLTSCIVVGAIIWVADFGLESLYKLLFAKP